MKKLLCASIFICCFSIFVFSQTRNLPCPEVTVSGPKDLVRAGDTVTFIVTSKDEIKVEELDFELKVYLKWKVSQGTIIQGQGTPLITVQTTPEMEGVLSVTVSVTITGLNSICNKEASETAVIEDFSGDCGLPDQYSKLSLEDEFSRIDNFLITLANNPVARGHIFFEIEKNEDLVDVKKRLTSVFDHIKNRNFNRDFILYDICYAEDNQTTFRIIPEGASLPEIPNCEKVYIDLK